jgi:ATP-dependent helicase/nuclease subunit B
LPSRRGCLALREAFLRASDGNPMLLPRMQPLGEVETDTLLSLTAPDETTLLQMPVASFEHKRLFLLARLIRHYQSTVHGKNERMDHALHQAKDIATLLDEVEREEATLENLATLVPDDFAAHWQLTTGFLSIVAEHWPALAAANKLTSQESWRNNALRQLAKAWQNAPPDYPVIAAGTTGSIPATANLLRVIAGLPNSAVVLPGYDSVASDNYMANITESHPQFGMRELLKELKAERSEVIELGTTSESGKARAAFLSRTLCPAENLEGWQAIPSDAAQAASGLNLITCSDQQEEALSISLLLREVLETEGKTVALVTHDRLLARRVVSQMHRFGVVVDDTAGQPLSHTPAGSFLRLLLDAAVDNASPIKLLALLKHPLTTFGMERIQCVEAARALEKALLRGLCPIKGIQGLKAEAADRKDSDDSVILLLKQLEVLLEPLVTFFAAGGREEFLTVLDKHIHHATMIAGEILWKRSESEPLLAIINSLRDSAEEAGEVELVSYAAVFNVLLQGKVVRPEFGMHPRLKILSPMEARMQSYDRVIIGGLNEGSWPAESYNDPWLNRTMRKTIGLEVPQRQIGQSAHDFVQLASAPEVFITRAQKVDGSPTTPARWWVRISELVAHYGLAEVVHNHRYSSWAQTLTQVNEITPCTRPAPVPPLSTRPREMAVTQVEKWLKDPYAFYAHSILKLKKLDDIDKDADATDLGKDVHKALELFAKRYASVKPEDAVSTLLHIGRDVFAKYDTYYPVVQAWWWPRFEQVAEWIALQENNLRMQITRVWPEVTGRFVQDGITFTGRADRIEELKDGSIAIVDYKTGSAHTPKETREGYAVQLMLLALLAQEGIWEADVGKKPLSRLEYWMTGGGRKDGNVRSVGEEQIKDMAITKERLSALVQLYNKPEQAYAASATSGKQEYNNYEHLARVKEWR